MLVASPAPNIRYLLPLLPGLAVAAGLALERLTVRARPGLLVATLAVAGAPLVVPGGGAVGAARLFGDTSPGGSRPAEGLSAALPDYAAMIGDVEREVPPDGLVLMIAEARGFFFTRPVLQDNVLLSWPVLDVTSSPRRCLRETSVTHVLVNYGSLRYYERRDMNPATLAWDAYEAFRERCLEPRGSSVDVVLYRLRAEPLDPALAAPGGGRP